MIAPKGSVHRKTVLKDIEYACFTAWPTASSIVGVIPGTLANDPAVMPAKRSVRDDAGRPASVAAGTTYLGRYFVNWFERMDR